MTAAKWPAQARWAAAHPLEKWAHVATASALRRGIIKRQACEVCGDPRVDAHHPDYLRPLEVVWLCRRHHKAAHRRQQANHA